jgi:hypothetical protein
LLVPDRRHRVRAGGRSTNHPADGSTDDSSDWPAYDSTDNRSCHRTARRTSVVRDAGA